MEAPVIGIGELSDRDTEKEAIDYDIQLERFPGGAVRGKCSCLLVPHKALTWGLR